LGSIAPLVPPENSTYYKQDTDQNIEATQPHIGYKQSAIAVLAFVKS
jgi:hypothetical protein